MSPGSYSPGFWGERKVEALCFPIVCSFPSRWNPESRSIYMRLSKSRKTRYATSLRRGIIEKLRALFPIGKVQYLVDTAFSMWSVNEERPVFFNQDSISYAYSAATPYLCVILWTASIFIIGAFCRKSPSPTIEYRRSEPSGDEFLYG